MKYTKFYYEKINLKMRIGHSQAIEFKEEVKTVLERDPPATAEDDTIVVDYTLEIDYFGSVAKRLDALLRLAERGLILEGSITELLNGRSLIFEMLRTLDKLKEYMPREGDVVERIGIL